MTFYSHLMFGIIKPYKKQGHELSEPIISTYTIKRAMYHRCKRQYRAFVHMYAKTQSFEQKKIVEKKCKETVDSLARLDFVLYISNAS